MDVASIVILLTSLGLGLAHSLDADHVVAVTTLVCNNKSIRKSVTSATVWGIGHSAVLLAVGSAVLILRVAIPESVVNVFEFAAAILLVILGIYVIRPLIMEGIHLHQHKAGIAHKHTHSHSHTPDTPGHRQLHKSALTGVLQGLGGTAALMLVTLTTVSTVEMGILFIVIFGVGVILGMVCISCLVGSVIAYAANRLEKVHKIIIAVTGSLSIAFGIGIILSIMA
jgi:cytochrome c biogenesis protein CcdA